MKNETRWCFVSDDDGHNYLIPVSHREKFNKDIQQAYTTDDFLVVSWIDQYRCGSLRNFSFRDPKENM